MFPEKKKRETQKNTSIACIELEEERKKRKAIITLYKCIRGIEKRNR